MEAAVADSGGVRPYLPWHPIMLDWKVALHEEPGGAPATDAGYLNRRYRLPADSPDLVPRRPGDTGSGRTSVVSGRSVLSPHPMRALSHALAGRVAPEHPHRHVEAFLDGVRARLDSQAPEETAAVSLSGLHAALLMHEPVPVPIGVEDPLGFADARAFAERVATAVGRHTVEAPRPQLHFMPLRAGRLQLLGLRLVDSFGRVQDVPLEESAAPPSVGSAEAVPSAPVGGRQAFVLPPRLMPPARLQMRWLAAGAAADEAHDHPGTGPICGWLVPDVLDGTLAVHGADGQAVGSVDGPGRWRPAPGGDRIVPPEDIANPHLRRVAAHLLHRTPDERRTFLATLVDALEKIEPDAHAQHRSLGLLLGRPVAVVRASVRVEILGSPPVDRSWAALRTAMAGGGRGDGGLREVRFPLRLGELGMLDDGLVGFGVEHGGGYGGFDGPFHVPRGLDLDGSGVVGGQLTLRPDAPVLHLTMLVDPRGAVHATTGVLPTKVLRIPPEQYGPALDGIGVTFLTAPLLGDPGTLNVAVPDEPGYAWSWLERTPTGWQELPASAMRAPRTGAAFAGVQELREGWLRLAPDAGGAP